MQASSAVSDASLPSLELRKGLSFFDPYLQYFVRQTLRVGGEARVAKDPDGSVTGLFIYDGMEKIGTIFTLSRSDFDHFYGLRPFNILFAELETEHECEPFDIYTTKLPDYVLDHRFRHEVTSAQQHNMSEIERFMVSANPGINKNWVRVAFEDREMCFLVRLAGEIAGAGWVSVTNSVGRLHSLFVRPQYRGLGIGEDILFARLFWLRSRGVLSAFSEISSGNVASTRVAVKGGMAASGRIFQYYGREQNSKFRPK